MYIRQGCVFSFEDAMKMQPASKLEKIMVTLNLEPVISMMPLSRTGPTGYSFEAKLRALIAARIEQIPSVAALVRRLNADPVFRYTCGFEVMGSAPSEAAFSRFIKQITELGIMEPLFQSMISRAESMGIIDGNVVSIDSTKLEAYEKSKPRKYISADGQNADWGAKCDTDGNKIKWFGNKVHQSVDTKSELPLAIIVTSASVHDSLPVIELMAKTRANIKADPKYWVMDSAYDSLSIYETVLNEYHAQAIIPLNIRNAKQPEAGLDFDGTPICSCGYRMIYWGHHKGTNKFRCPHILGKVNCPFGSAWCSTSNYGMVAKTRVKENPRLFNAPHRGTSNWQQLYDKRTASERCFSRQKEHLGLENLKVQGIMKVETHVYLCSIALYATVIAVNSPLEIERAA